MQKDANAYKCIVFYAPNANYNYNYNYNINNNYNINYSYNKVRPSANSCLRP